VERIELDHERLQKALNRLGQYIVDYHESQDEETLLKNQTVIIKSFEYCYEMLWKYLKLYIEQEFGLIVSSPRKVFRECMIQKITNESETKQLLQMVDHRNLTTHTYHETLGERVCAAIPDHYILMKAVIERVKPKG